MPVVVERTLKYCFIGILLLLLWACARCIDDHKGRQNADGGLPLAQVCRVMLLAAKRAAARIHSTP